MACGSDAEGRRSLLTAGCACLLTGFAKTRGLLDCCGTQEALVGDRKQEMLWKVNCDDGYVVQAA